MKFYFMCYCGCGHKSEPLDKDYVRLVNKSWSKKGHEGNSKIIAEFKKGLIIKQEEF